MNRLSLLILLLFSNWFVGLTQVRRLNDTIHSNDTIFYQQDPDPSAWIEYETMPEFPDGPDSLISFAKRHLTYPKTLINDSIEGKVVMKFSVDDKGIAGDVVFLRSLHPELEKQCNEMVKQLPRFKPGTMLTKTKKGWYWRPAMFWYVLPVYFTVTNRNPYKLKLVITPYLK